jgi:hypothetical protein
MNDEAGVPQAGLPSQGEKLRLGLPQTQQDPLALPAGGGPAIRLLPMVGAMAPDAVRVARFFKRQGFLHSNRMVRALRAANIQPQTAAALLTMETGNGRGVYGHDPVATGGCYAPGAPVTRQNCDCYKRFRGTPGRNMQGVGPAQLTWWEFQDRADRLGGCWRPYPNMLVGFQIIRAYVDAGASIWEAYRRYNGAAAYADKAVAWRTEWERRLRAAGL